MKQHLEATTGAWLVLGGSREPSSTTLFDAPSQRPADERPLTPAECLGLSAVLVAWHPRHGRRLSDAVAEAFRPADHAAGAVAEWIAAVLSRRDAGAHSVASEACELLEELGRDLRVAALPAARCVEAELLVGSLQLLREHLGLQQQFEDRLRAARLEAVRQLAYGAGHEINNPLANIATRGQSLLRDEPDPERRRKLATIVDQAFRARDMIGGLMVFAKPPVASLARVDLGGLTESVVGSLCDLPVAEGVEVATAVPPEPVWAHIDARLVAEALQAVLINALEAVAAGGVVRVHVLADCRDGFHAVVVNDSGPGMDAGEQAVACDPFHCGREAGRGLGVGLSKAWALASACGGRLALGVIDGDMSVRLELPAEPDGAASVSPPSPVVGQS